MGNPVVHFELLGKDGQKLRDFYTQLFDWKLTQPAEGMDYSMVDTGEGIGGGIGTNPDGKPWLTFYVATEDPKASLAKAVELGAEVIMDVSEVPGAGVTIATFRDPEGNTVGLVKSG